MAAPLLLCDTPGLLYRGFFALPDSIKGAEGRPVNALVGSVNMTLWCVEKYQPRAVIMCFGQESADYRVEAYPDYHAARPEMPDDLAWQWERAPDLYRGARLGRAEPRVAGGGRPDGLARGGRDRGRRRRR